MSQLVIFQIQLVVGYAACLLFFRAYVLPRLKEMSRVDAQRAIATLHSFRFFGLAFIVPGVVGPNLPASFAAFAAYWDFAAGILAILALVTVRWKPLFWGLVVAFNVVGAIDLVLDYYHAMRIGVPEMAGQLGALYWVPVLYVPMLMITHIAAFWLLLRVEPKVVRNVAQEVGTA